jgi:hypothetical protein
MFRVFSCFDQAGCARTLMVMRASESWRELYRVEDASLVDAVATSIQAIGFDARIVSPRGRGGHFDRDRPAPPPYVVQVPDECWDDLRDVLDMIVAEQLEFDVMLEHRDLRRGRVERRCMLVLVVVVGAFAVLGWIRL